MTVGPKPRFCVSSTSFNLWSEHVEVVGPQLRKHASVSGFKRVVLIDDLNTHYFYIENPYDPSATVAFIRGDKRTSGDPTQREVILYAMYEDLLEVHLVSDKGARGTPAGASRGKEDVHSGNLILHIRSIHGVRTVTLRWPVTMMFVLLHKM